MTFFGAYFRSRRERRAIREYARRLPRLLVRDYGFSRSYTAQQVKKTLEREGFDTEFIAQALAMFTDRDDFNKFYPEFGDSRFYDEVRAGIAETYFDGNPEFTVSDVFGLSSDSGADAAHGGSHGGDGHGI
jgi:hypothetical protein